ncbi:MAG: ABC transporter permease [Silvibacterium sp.]|nr:ABC transporter permease [Silvibacterium sp.]
MSFSVYVRSLVSTFFRRSRMNGEIKDELGSHIQHRADDLERSGVPRAEAERQARIEFGGYERFRQECHEELGGHFLDIFLQDLRFALRALRKSPGFLLVSVLTLAMAIGANAVVFSLMNGLILRSLNVPEARNLYTIQHGTDDESPFQSYLDYLDLRDRNRTFAGIAAYSMDKAGIDTGGRPSAAWLYAASGNYFDVLDVQPYLGRFFHASDEHGPNSAPYVVLSYAYWHSRFQADRNVVGRTVLMNRYPYTIAGVAPPDFRGTELFFVPDFWVPMVDEEQIAGNSDLTERGARGSWLVGRLKPGVTPEQATADLNLIAAYLSKAYPKDDDGMSFTLTRPGLIGDMLGRPVRAFLVGLTLLAGLILLAACSNLGSLFTARAADHSREIALRLALGSSRRRILRQMLIEAVLISLMGGAVGLAGSMAMLRWLARWQPMSNLPINSVPVNPDISVYGVALLLAVASGLMFGLVPIRQVLRANPWQVVKSGAASASTRRFTVRDVLLVVQIAICAVLVTSSLVAVRGLVRSLQSSFGFEPQNALLVETDIDMAGYNGERVGPMQRRMLEALESIPGVSAVGLADRLPLALDWNEDLVFKDGTADRKISNAAAESVMYDISPGYFRAAGTPLRMGRIFTSHDDKNAPLVAIVNHEFARKLFGSEKAALGGYFRRMDGTRIQVVGVVEDGKHKTLAEDPQPAIFLPILQSPSSSSWLVVRSKRDPVELTPVVESTLRNLDAGLPFTVRTWEKELDSALFTSRIATASLGILGALGAMLAVTGIFGMAAYSVSKRLRELGIRIALGAQRKEVITAALGRAFRLLAFGSATGLILGLAATRILSYIVYEATPRDPLVLAGVIFTMLLLGLLATWIPASRALEADPMALLREE